MPLIKLSSDRKNSFQRHGQSCCRDVDLSNQLCSSGLPEVFMLLINPTYSYFHSLTQLSPTTRSIVETCLKENTLVSLPTGLGKTLIAAVVCAYTCKIYDVLPLTVSIYHCYMVFLYR